MHRRYYTGYAQFFDATTNNCDSVSWHVWLNLFTRQYLTQARRQRMNDLVVDMNSKLQAAVQRGGDQVVFVDYDAYVGFLGGRYCLPGVDEDKGNGANRDYAFFYQMKTADTPFMPANDNPYHDELRKRDNSTEASEGTIDAEIGSWMAETIQQNPSAQLNDDVANSDLDASVATEEHKRMKKRSPLTPKGRIEHRGDAGAVALVQRFIESSVSLSSSWAGNTSTSVCASGTTWGSASGATRCVLGTGKPIGSASHKSSSTKSSSRLVAHTTSSAFLSRSSVGTTVSSGFLSSGHYRPSIASSGLYPNHSAQSANISKPHPSGSYTIHPTGSTHSISLYTSGTGRIFPTGTASASLGFNHLNSTSRLELHEDAAIAGYVVPDSVGRVFHPNQAGHAMIANLIMYEMSARVAKSIGPKVPSQNLTDIGESCLLTPSPACSGGSTDTWAARDAEVSAVTSFCSNYQNTAGSAGKTTSSVFNQNSLDYLNVSIQWGDDVSIGENQCNAWFDTVIDGCDTDGSDKHGGSIGFAQNATLKVTPLVMRRQWDGGQPTAHQCNGISGNHYVTQSTLASNIQDFCTASAAQPNGIANSGSTFTKDYNTGTPDYVTLKTTWPSGALNYQVFVDECNYYMNTIMNGCDVPSSGNNPLNWKGGGSMSDNNKVTYTITPNDSRAPAPNAALGNCKSWYKVFWATFDVYGGGWADSDFGKTGGGVYDQIRGCGAITYWKFEYYDTPAADGTEWHASGRLPIGTRGCLGRAVTSSGGFTGGCGGNG